MECEVISAADRGYDWGYEKETKCSQWNGKLVQPLAADFSMQSIYSGAKVTRANLDASGTAQVYQVNYYSSNDDSYNSLNDPSSANDRDNSSSNSSNSHDNSSSPSAPRNKVSAGVGVDSNGNKEVNFKAGHSGDIRNGDGEKVGEYAVKGGGAVNEKGDGAVRVDLEFSW